MCVLYVCVFVCIVCSCARVLGVVHQRVVWVLAMHFTINITIVIHCCYYYFINTHESMQNEVCDARHDIGDHSINGKLSCGISLSLSLSISLSLSLTL